MRTRFKIKNKLVICFGAILVIGFIISGLMANQVFKKIIEESTLKNLSRLAKDTADKVNIILNEKQKGIEKLAKLPEVRDEQLLIPDKLLVLNEWNTFLDFKEITWIDLVGNIYSRSSLNGNIGDTVEFKEAIKGQTTFSPTIKYDEEICFNILVPVIDKNEQLIGLIMGIENIESFTYIVAETGMSDAYMIWDSEASILDSFNEKMFDKDQIIGEFQEKLEGIDYRYEKEIRQSSGTGYCTDPQTGEKSYISYAGTDMGWSLALINHRSRISGLLREFNYSVVGVTIMIIIVGLVVVYWMAREMSIRINGITHYLDTVAQGDFEQPVPSDLLELKDEMGDAARALEGMKLEIEEMLDTIKRYTDYMNDQMEDLTDGIKEEIKVLLNSDELDDRERHEMIERLHYLKKMIQGVNDLETNNL